MISPNPRRRLRPGDRLVVSNRPELVFVERLESEPDGRVKAILDWGEFGKSRVFEDDEGKTWVFYETVN